MIPQKGYLMFKAVATMRRDISDCYNKTPITKCSTCTLQSTQLQQTLMKYRQQQKAGLLQITEVSYRAVSGSARNLLLCLPVLSSGLVYITGTSETMQTV